MGQMMMFSKEKWAEPVRTNWYPVQGGVIKTWREKGDEEMRATFLPGMTIEWKVRFEVQEERIRQQLAAEMEANKNLSEEQKKHISKQADIFIPLTRNLTALKDILDEQLKEEQFESEHPLVKYSPLNTSLLKSLVDLAASLFKNVEFQFLRDFANNNNEPEGAMNLKVVYEFKIV